MTQNFLLALLLFTSISNAQDYILTTAIQRDLIKGINNPLVLVVNGKTCPDCSLTTDNGRVERVSSDRKFTIYPDSVGSAKVIIYNKSGKEIGKEYFRVKEIDLSVCIPGFEDVIDDVNRFSKSAHMQLHSDEMLCLDFTWKATYEVIIIDDSKKTVYHVEANHGRPTPEVREQFALLKPGDMVIFHNIRIAVSEIKVDVADIVLDVK